MGALMVGLDFPLGRFGSIGSGWSGTFLVLGFVALPDLLGSSVDE